MTLNDSYKAWKENPSDDSYNELGKALLWYINKQLRTLKYYSISITLSDEMVEDAQGNTLIKVFEYLPTYNPEKSSFSTWVYAIIKHVVADIIEEATKRNEYPLFENTAVSKDPFGGINGKLLIQKLLSQLNEEDKSFVKMKMDGFSNPNIAEHFQRDINWVENNWKKILKHLRKLV